MELISHLEKVLTKEELNSFLSNNQITKNESGYTMSDFNALAYIIFKEYPNFSFCECEDKNLFNSIKAVFRFVYLGQDLFAYELSKRILRKHNIPEIRAILENVDKNKVKVEYMANDDPTFSAKKRKELEEKERQLLYSFIQGEIQRSVQLYNQLSNEYKHASPLQFVVFNNYLSSIKSLLSNKRRINVRNHTKYSAELLIVINNVLKAGDYLEAHDLLSKYYLNYERDEFSIRYEIIRVLDQLLMEQLAKNNEYIKSEIEINSNGYNEINEIVKHYDISQLSRDEVDAMGVKKNNKIDEARDYFSEYVKYKTAGDYENALEAIVMHSKKMAKLGKPCNFEYMIRELKIHMKNNESSSKDVQTKYLVAIRVAEKAYMNGDYEKAIRLYNESFEYEKIKSPCTYARLAECYYSLNNKEEALKCFKKQSTDNMYPMDLIHYIECLYYTGEYELIPQTVAEFDFIYPQSSPIIHYILAIYYAKEKNYKMALSEISSCEIILFENNGLPIKLIYEKNILNTLEKGGTCEMFTLDNYSEYCFDDSLLERTKSLGIDDSHINSELLLRIVNSCSNDNLDDKLNYLVQMYKILMCCYNDQEAKKIYNYIKELFEISNPSDSSQEYFTNITKNYRNL